MLLLAKGMPMRLLDNVSRKLKLFRGRRCTLWNWSFDDNGDSKVEYETVNGDCVVSKLPKVLYLQFHDASFQVEGLPVGVYPLKQRKRSWIVNKATGISVSRTSFCAIMDFGSTVHQVQGKTEKALLAGFKSLEASCNIEDLVHAYVTLSRVGSSTRVKVLDAFSPMLLQQCPPPDVFCAAPEDARNVDSRRVHGVLTRKRAQTVRRPETNVI
jgi:hypothetical protein